MTHRNEPKVGFPLIIMTVQQNNHQNYICKNKIQTYFYVNQKFCNYFQRQENKRLLISS